MIHNASFRRKVIYLGLIALLLIPLYVVGHPAVGDPGAPQSSPGGRLAQLRSEYDLSPAELGEIDPTSESMKLATLGMRGIAANILWTKANEYKMKENWEGLVAVVNQMARLQPNFISVWEFQSHNLSYNISVEQDDYRFRYLWVKKGIEFLIQGTKYNRREPKLYWTLGWYTGQKFGRADEHKQFRRLYRDDHDFHDLQSEHIDIYGDAGGPDGKPDTWLSSRLWFLRAYNLVDAQGRPIRGKSPHIFYADGPKARMNYSVTIEEEGYLDEKAEVSWKKSGDEWFELGNRTIPTTWGVTIRLNEEEELLADAERLKKELDEMVPGAREAIRLEKLNSLTPKQREAYELPPEKVTDDATYHARYEAGQKMMISYREIAERAPESIRALAYHKAAQALEAETVAGYVDRYRQNVAFEYWRTRCQVEQLHDTVQARKHIYTAQQLMDKVEYTAARAEFEKAWELWANIMDENPGLLDQLTSDDLYDHFAKYADLLNQLDAQIPADFKLRPLIEKHGEYNETLKRIFAPPTKSTSETTEKASPADTTKESDEKKKSDSDGKNEDDKKKDDKKKDDKKKDDKKKDDEKKDDEKKDDEKKDNEAKSKPADEKKAAAGQEKDTGPDKKDAGTEKKDDPGSEKKDSGAEKKDAASDKPKSEDSDKDAAQADKPADAKEDAKSDKPADTEKKDPGAEKKDADADKSADANKDDAKSDQPADPKEDAKADQSANADPKSAEDQPEKSKK